MWFGPEMSSVWSDAMMIDKALITFVCDLLRAFVGYSFAHEHTITSHLIELVV